MFALSLILFWTFHLADVKPEQVSRTESLYPCAHREWVLHCSGVSKQEYLLQDCSADFSLLGSSTWTRKWGLEGIVMYVVQCTCSVKLFFNVPLSSERSWTVFCSTVISRMHVWGHWAVVFLIRVRGIVFIFSLLPFRYSRVSDCLAYAAAPHGAKQMELIQQKLRQATMHSTILFVKGNNWAGFLWLLFWYLYSVRGENHPELISVTSVDLESTKWYQICN